MSPVVVVLVSLLILVGPFALVALMIFCIPLAKGQRSYLSIYLDHFFTGRHFELAFSRRIANGRILCECVVCHKKLWINTLDINDPDHFRPVTEKILISTENSFGTANADFVRKEVRRQLEFLYNNEEYRSWQTEDWRQRNPLPSESKEVDHV